MSRLVARTAVSANAAVVNPAHHPHCGALLPIEEKTSQWRSGSLCVAWMGRIENGSATPAGGRDVERSDTRSADAAAATLQRSQPASSEWPILKGIGNHCLLFCPGVIRKRSVVGVCLWLLGRDGIVLQRSGRYGLRRGGSHMLRMESYVERSTRTAVQSADVRGRGHIYNHGPWYTA
jgi:hypothetical protein